MQYPAKDIRWHMLDQEPARGRSPRSLVDTRSARNTPCHAWRRCVPAVLVKMPEHGLLPLTGYLQQPENPDLPGQLQNNAEAAWQCVWRWRLQGYQPVPGTVRVEPG